MGLGGIHPRVLKEMDEVRTKSLSIIHQQLWLAREAPADWRLADVLPGDRKGWKDFPGNYRPVSLTSVSGQVTEQVILSAVTRHLRDSIQQGSKFRFHVD